jgi:hypothetical protein
VYQSSLLRKNLENTPQTNKWPNDVNMCTGWTWETLGSCPKILSGHFGKGSGKGPCPDHTNASIQFQRWNCWDSVEKYTYIRYASPPLFTTITARGANSVVPEVAGADPAPQYVGNLSSPLSLIRNSASLPLSGPSPVSARELPFSLLVKLLLLMSDRSPPRNRSEGSKKGWGLLYSRPCQNLKRIAH